MPIETKTIAEISKMKFIIPAYQRGYRWSNLQVEQLLNDLWEFYTSPKSSWYCLQPLVVKNVELSQPNTVTSAQWTVIDGQQRLTTLYIILRQLDTKGIFSQNEGIYSLKYETRECSQGFLEKVEAFKKSAEPKQEKNPDYHFIQEAANAVDEWIKDNKLTQDSCLDFIRCIQANAKFIWYETKENSYDVFTRLNSGKISLSNAELIKALLLRENRFHETSGSVKLQQLEISSEWDRIEQVLHQDEFWYFINPAAAAVRFHATRIDFLFELILRNGLKGNSIQDYSSELEKNPYFAFNQFADFCKESKEGTPESVIWAKIQSIFRRIKAWHEDRRLYHYVGFLMNQKGDYAEKRISTLCELLEKSEAELHSDFIKNVREKCGATISGSPELNKLEYNEHNPKLNNVLLLFNLALLDRENIEQSRYPFKTHTGTAWSLEHIHAKQERELNDNDAKDLAKELSCEENAPIDIDILKGKLKTKYGDSVTIEKREGGEQIEAGLFLICKGQETHGLGNLALLERAQNSKFNNRLYPEKRRILAEWERGINQDDGRPEFIPLGTKMVFFKHFSPTATAPFVWDDYDSKSYFETIVKTVAKYVGLDNVLLLLAEDPISLEEIDHKLEPKIAL